ncbi:class C sortase [Ruminococcus sp.]|uniref:class C sortase n=1 Tax=Ruminococcus sp. TaxID=41978 RepID=UPI003866B899
MKRYLPIIAIVLIFLIGLGILTYPLLSSVINNIGIRNEAKIEYQKAQDMQSEEVEALFAEADAYNKSLLNTVILTDPFDEEAYEAITAHYEETFNIADNGLIGYIDIPKINVYLPIYHGTSTEVLERGAGHLENTAFPVGGKNTHSVISAHTAFPTETFFDYLTDMEEGDYFYIHVLNRVLTYQVDQIKVVLPDNTHDLYVEDGRDLVTLLTCTPYSINSHRLLVRGTRVEDQDPGDVTTVSTGDDYLFFMGYKISFVTAGIVIAVFLLFVAGVVFVAIRMRRKKTPAHSADKKDGGPDA